MKNLFIKEVAEGFNKIYTKKVAGARPLKKPDFYNECLLNIQNANLYIKKDKAVVVLKNNRYNIKFDNENIAYIIPA